MMKYYKEHILEEIKGAEEYMSKAVEHKQYSCGPTFYMMAMDELRHANTLTKMMAKDSEPQNAETSEAYKAVLEAYTEGMNKIEALKKIYWEM